MDLKKILKNLKLHQEMLSIALGIIILLFAGIFVIRYVKSLNNQTSDNNPPVETQNQTYKVAKGDSLWKISLKFYKNGNDWKKIADANNIKSPSQIEVGQNLIIPNISELNTETVHTASPTPTPKPQITNEAASTTNEIKENTYTVIKGDNLWNIAVRAYGDGTMWHKIAEANKLVNPRIIHSGNTFTIPR